MSVRPRVAHNSVVWGLVLQLGLVRGCGVGGVVGRNGPAEVVWDGQLAVHLIHHRHHLGLRGCKVPPNGNIDQPT